ncbi:MAG: HEPN domain-containing protein [Methanobacteriota archaeon]|nr:MAG: HEPN domain-containing protein [Euryarchaeota archaeon]
MPWQGIGSASSPQAAQDTSRSPLTLRGSWGRSRNSLNRFLFHNRQIIGAMRKEAENWFKQATADLKTARDCLRTENYYACAFFSQQSVEKALKALFLIEKQETPSKSHNLLDLSLELNIPEEFLTVARELTPEFIITRYPDAAGGAPVELYDNSTAKDILEKAERFFAWIQEKIG